MHYFRTLAVLAMTAVLLAFGCTEIGKGTNPAAAAANGRIVYAFVEPNDRTRTVRFGIK